MLVFKIHEFAGIIPRFPPRQLLVGYGSVALDVDLTHGTLKPFHEPKDLFPVNPNSTQIYAWGCRVLAWEGCVSVAQWIPDCPRLFITGYGAYPQVITLEGDNIVYRRMGVPQPDKAVTVQANNVYTDKARSTAYVVTFVNSFGEESAPSVPSVDVSIEDGQGVDINFSYSPDIEWDVKTIRIYRRETGYNTGLEKEQEFKTYWFFVAELPITATYYHDEVKILDLGWALDTRTTRPPPANLENITAIPDTAILAGSIRNKLLFSKNMQPHNWMLSQELTLDDNVVAMGAANDKLYVATDGHPYVVQADAGCDDLVCREVFKMPVSLPMINCHIGHGGITTPFGFIYASPDGAVLLSDTKATVITTDVLSIDDWRSLQPHTMRFAYYKGALFMVSEGGSFIYWLDGTTYKDAAHKKFVAISDEPVDMVTTRQGELLLLRADGMVQQWDAGDNLRPYLWMTNLLETGFLFDITRIGLDVASRDVRTTLFFDGGQAVRTFPTGNRIIPFGRHGRRKSFQVEFYGTGEVRSFVGGLVETDMAMGGGK